MYAESSYQILGTPYRGDSPGIQAALAEVYGTDERPRCLCVERGIEMYVAQHAQLVIKRMPGTGAAHHPSCPSYEAPPGETGLGDLLGEAVIERGPERVEVRLDFPLSHVSVPRPAQAPSAPSQSVSAAQRRLSMRGLLHLLWDRAGFSRWSPRMEGKRSWFVIRKYLLEAAAEIDAKGTPLASRLFIPEPFRPDESEGLKARRAAFFGALRLDAAGDHVPLALLVAEVKDLIERGDGYSMILKHLPDCLLALDSTTGRQLARRFERELLAKAQQPDTRLIVGCTIRPAAEGLGHADTLAMMAVTPEWLPFEHLLERALLVELVRQGRRFLKPLPYEAGPSAAFASALLLDTGDAALPLHLEPPSASGQRGSRADGELSVPGPKRWIWRPGEALLMPALPKPVQVRERSVVSQRG
jgi:Protein of unknown function (DUF1173)